MKARPNYGQDSPRIVAALSVLGVALCCLAYLLASTWRWISLGFGVYFLFGASGLLFYSKVGKLGMRERLLDRIPWRGNERVLDVGCGRGLLTVGAAHRVPAGSVVGVDIWNPSALLATTQIPCFATLQSKAWTTELKRNKVMLGNFHLQMPASMWWYRTTSFTS